MTQSIHDAAQAVLDAGDMIGTVGSHARADAMRTAVARLRAALSAPQPTADERVAEHMDLVYEAGSAAFLQNDDAELAAMKAVEQSARALLSASQEDADMLDWLDDNEHLFNWGALKYMGLRAAIRSAMGAKETK